MSKLNELIDSLTNENVDEMREQLTSEANARDKTGRQLYTRTKKAEGFEKSKDGNWIKKEKPTKADPKPIEPKKSNEPDYAKIAFLNGKGIEHSDDQKLVQDEAERLKMPLTDILEMEHIKSKLKGNKDERESQAGMPKGKGRSGGTTQDVDYWLSKPQKKDGTYETPDDSELATKVINARITKQEKGQMFSDELYNG